MLTSILLVIIGLAVLTVGAEGLVRAGVSFALRLGVTPLVIGLTIVAFGTGSPELVVSAQAALSGSSGLALGNVVGSNISNTLLILGCASLIFPIRSQADVIKREMPILTLVTGGLWLMTLDGTLGRIDGIVLFSGSIIYTVTVYYLAKRDEAHGTAPPVTDEVADKPNPSLVLDIVYLVVGLALLIVGSKLMVDGAVEIAKILNISDVVIGLTVIAIGTSLPELATSAVAAWREESDLAVGNAIGSNIFNILCVLGLTAMIQPLETGSIRVLDFAVLLGSVLFVWALLGIRMALDRIEGAILLAAYAIYIYTLIPQ